MLKAKVLTWFEQNGTIKTLNIKNEKRHHAYHVLRKTTVFCFPKELAKKYNHVFQSEKHERRFFVLIDHVS